MNFQRLVLYCSLPIDSLDTKILSRYVLSSCLRYEIETIEALGHDSSLNSGRSASTKIQLIVDRNSADDICHAYRKPRTFVFHGERLTIRAQRYVKYTQPVSCRNKKHRRHSVARSSTQQIDDDHATNDTPTLFEKMAPCPRPVSKPESLAYYSISMTQIVDDLGNDLLVAQEVFERFSSPVLTLREVIMAIESAASRSALPSKSLTLSQVLDHVQHLLPVLSMSLLPVEETTMATTRPLMNYSDFLMYFHFLLMKSRPQQQQQVSH